MAAGEGELLEAIRRMDERVDAAGVAGQFVEEDRARLPVSDLYDYDEAMDVKNGELGIMYTVHSIEAMAQGVQPHHAIMSIYLQGVAVGVLLERARHE